MAHAWQEGILFRDIFPIFRDHILVEALVTHLVHRITSTQSKIDVVVGTYAFLPVLSNRLHHTRHRKTRCTLDHLACHGVTAAHELLTRC